MYTCHINKMLRRLYQHIDSVNGRLERDEGKLLINIQERKKYESSYTIDSSMIKYQYQKAFKL